MCTLYIMLLCLCLISSGLCAYYLCNHIEDLIVDRDYYKNRYYWKIDRVSALEKQVNEYENIFENIKNLMPF